MPQECADALLSLHTRATANHDSGSPFAPVKEKYQKVRLLASCNTCWIYCQRHNGRSGCRHAQAPGTLLRAVLTVVSCAVQDIFFYASLIAPMARLPAELLSTTPAGQAA